MDKSKRRPFDSRADRKIKKSNFDASPGLERLTRQFAAFRREHSAGTRIPDVLREAALAAMRQGVTRTQLRRACGVSWGQVEQWQKNHGAVTAQADLGTPAARVFSVVGDIPTRGDAPADWIPEQSLELRVGGWAVTVRSAGRYGQGGPACCR